MILTARDIAVKVYSKGIKRLGEALLGLSQEVPNQPPRWPSSGFLSKLQCNPRSEKLASTSLDAELSVGVHRVDADTTSMSTDIDANLAFGQNSKTCYGGEFFSRSAQSKSPMASRGRRGVAPAREDEPRREEQAEQQAPAPQGPVLPPPPPVDYGVFMQGLVQAMQTQEGDIQQYLEEKKASQKRPAATFQRQDKKKAVYQAPQRPVTTSSAQELDVKPSCRQDLQSAASDLAVNLLERPDTAVKFFSAE
ncbi:hypothetical protein Taro_003032 [Colocasia esculenta]|uniref:Uncharacterized protein n=1 Tax=Colocasia esculenta TaxID=4460 RepID=A0A843TED4_COLES|nr:hypothetical protein [Colocasia esculenta]